MSQSMTRPVGVNVFGSHIVRTEPDRAEVDLAVIRLAQTPASAFEQTGKAVRAVRNALKVAGIPDADVEVSKVNLETAYDRFGQTGKFLGYRSTVSFRFVLGRLDAVEQLITSAVEAVANEVRRVTYQSSKLRELRGGARKQAVEAARRKAEIYCEAAGVRLGSVVDIEDVNPDVGLYRSSFGHNAAGIEPSAEVDEEPGSGLKPGSLVISAAVVMTFNILHD
jgi:uncharacterized protein YggE